MSDENLQFRKTAVGVDRPVPAQGSLTRRPAGSGSLSGTRVAKPRRGLVFALVVILLTVGAAGVWTFVARRQLAASLVAENTAFLDRAQKTFVGLRARTQAALQELCRVLAEDPRLKATLATEGMDEATVADILTDLGKLRGTGFLMVLSPEGRVFAQSGADNLRGLDLSESSVVKKAQSSSEATVGSWVLDNKVYDLSTMSVRYDTDVIAFIVVGQPVDAALLQAVAEQTGVQVASALADKVVLGSSSDPALQTAFAAAARQAGTYKGRVISVGGQEMVTGVVELPEATQTQRLVLVRPLGAALPSFQLLQWMMFVPPVLVLLAVLFAMMRPRDRRSA